MNKKDWIYVIIAMVVVAVVVSIIFIKMAEKDVSLAPKPKCEMEATSHGNCEMECKNVVKKKCVFGQVVKDEPGFSIGPYGNIVTCETTTDSVPRNRTNPKIAINCLCCS